MGTNPSVKPDKLMIGAPVSPEFAEILSPEALAFIAELERNFGPRRRELLERRVQRQAAIDAGQLPDFLPETESVRAAEWTVAPIPADLTDRRVEITGPVDRKMVINALNSGASVFMADFEDSNSPTWSNNIQGQINLRDAVAGDHFVHQPRGQGYALGAQDRHPAGAAARLAPGREARRDRTASRSPARCSISACTSSTTPRR